MSDVTFGYDAEWGPTFRGVRRTVTVGRMRAIGSLVHANASSPVITTCPKCHGLRYDLGGPHSVLVAGGVRRDCVGDIVA